VITSLRDSLQFLGVKSRIYVSYGSRNIFSFVPDSAKNVKCTVFLTLRCGVIMMGSKRTVRAYQDEVMHLEQDERALNVDYSER